MSARKTEADLLTRCTVVAREGAQAARDRREANVFCVAAAALQSRFPREAESLLSASERYFATHPNERMAAVDVVRSGWVTSLPRLRSMLCRRLA